MKTIAFILICFVFLCSVPARTQNAPVTIAGIVLDPGPDVIVPVEVVNFNDIGAISLTMEYDYHVVHVVNIIPNDDLDGFSATWTLVPGRIKMAWIGNSGVTLPDYSHLVDISFTGLHTGETDLTWIDNGISCEYAKYNGGANTVLNDIPFNDYYKNGHIKWQRPGPKTIAPFYCSPANQDICIPITVNQFTNVGSISLKLDYDPAVLEFQSINSSTIPSDWTFNGQAINPGRLIVGGIGPGIPFLQDGSVLFNACFHYKGGTSALTWYDANGISCEYADAGSLTPLADRPMTDYYTNGSVGPPLLNADFSTIVTNPPKNTTVHFTDNSTGSPTAWDWSFDPSTVTYQNTTNSHSQDPDVQFTAGCLYNVTLVIHNSYEYCSDAETKIGYIRVGIRGLWTGAVNTDWATPGNWDDCYVPDASTDVTIPASAPNWPVYTYGDFTIGAQCKTITLTAPTSHFTATGNLNIP